MFDRFIMLEFVVGIVIVLFVTPFIFAKGIYTMEYGTLTTREKIKCMIPIVNIASAESLYMGKLSKVLISTLWFAVSLLTRIVVILVCPRVHMLHLVTIIALLVSIAIYYIMNVWLVFLVIYDANTVGLVSNIMYALVFPFGHYYIGTSLPKKLKNLRKGDKFK